MTTTTATPTTTPTPTGAERRRTVVLVAMCVGMFFVLLDVTIVNVALPALRDDLHLGASGLQWVVDADTLAFACLMLSAGTLGDMTGRKRLVLAGMALVAIGSVLCALSGGLAPLLAGRAVQGVGGALMLPQSLAIIAAAYPEPGEQARAIGLWAGVSSLALPLGPLLGGVLVDRFGWPAVFWVNVPIVAAAFVLAARFVPESPPDRGRRLDPPGQLLVTAGVGLLVAGLVEAGERGWTAPLVLAMLAAGAVALGAFVAGERRASDPMIARDLLSRPGFVPANAVGFLMNFGGVGTLYLVALFLQVVQGRSALAAGLMLLPGTLPLVVLAPWCARLADRVGWRRPMVAGMATAAVSGLLLATVPADAGVGVLALVLLALGVGLTLNTAPMVAAVMASAPPVHRSLASASNNTARQIGSALGIAVLGSIAGDPAGAGFVGGFHRAALMAAAGWALAALVATRAPAAPAPPAPQRGSKAFAGCARGPRGGMLRWTPKGGPRGVDHRQCTDDSVRLRLRVGS